MSNLYTPELAGSGQFGVCCKCGLLPDKSGHDGCLGELDASVVMNACCGHGDDSIAYVQLWDGNIITGNYAISMQLELKSETRK